MFRQYYFLLGLSFICCCALHSGTAASDPANNAQEQNAVSSSDSDEIAARKKLAQAILDGRIPINQIPVQSDEPNGKIFAALDNKVSVSFKDKPLFSVLEKIATDSKIRAWVNTPELDLQGIPSNTRVTLEAGNVELRKVLERMLEPLRLTFTVHNGVLQVTTKDSADSILINRVVLVPKELANDTFSVLNAIQQTVRPDTWLAAGGNSSILPLENLLVIRAPLPTQYAVQDLLAEMLKKKTSQSGNEKR